MITLLLTFCFLNYDGSPTEDCSRLAKSQPSIERCMAYRAALPPDIEDGEGRALVIASCVKLEELPGHPT